jgi:hypothetical protein
MQETVVTVKPPPGIGSQPTFTTIGKLSVSGQTLKTVLTCNGSPLLTCSDALTLTVTERLSGGRVIAVTAARRDRATRKRATTTTGVVTIGSGHARFYTSQTRTVKITLNKTGGSLLETRKRLEALLTVVQDKQFQTRKLSFHR